jgi:hypothetical protein
MMSMNPASRWAPAIMAGLTGLALLMPATPAFAHGKNRYQVAAVRLEQSLRALGIPHVSLLFAYLESIRLTRRELVQIGKNVKEIGSAFGGVRYPNNLSLAQKEEALRLFLDTMALMHLKADFVKADGQPVTLLSYRSDAGSHLLVQIRDERGRWLADIHPHHTDLAPATLTHLLYNAGEAARAAYILEQSPTFVPMPGGQIP